MIFSCHSTSMNFYWLLIVLWQHNSRLLQPCYTLKYDFQLTSIYTINLQFLISCTLSLPSLLCKNSAKTYFRQWLKYHLYKSDSHIDELEGRKVEHVMYYTKNCGGKTILRQLRWDSTLTLLTSSGCRTELGIGGCRMHWILALWLLHIVDGLSFNWTDLQRIYSIWGAPQEQSKYPSLKKILPKF